MECSECPPGSALALTLRISRLAGVAPVSFTPNGLRISRPFAFYSYLLVTVTSCVILCGFALDMLTEPKRSVRVRTPTSRMIWITNFTIIILITCIAAYKSPSRLESVINSMKNIQKIKVFLKEENADNFNEKHKIAMVVLISIALWCLILCDLYEFMLDALSYGREVRTLLMYSFLYYEYFLELLVKFQFILIVMKLLSVLKLVNKALKKLVLVEDTQIPGNVIKSRLNSFAFKACPVVPNKAVNIVIDSIAASETYYKSKYFYDNKMSIRNLYNAYGAICDILRGIDEGHGLILLFILIEFFLQLIITPYYLITALLTSSEKILNLILQISWCLYHIIIMLMVVEPCYQIQKETDKTQVLVCDLMRKVPPTEAMFDDIDIFWKQLSLDRPSFTPFGMCTLSRPLIVTIIGAVTTYLVIIFQFRTYECSDNA